ncbi:glutathione S-transferase N-terminal domain-containing protein [Anaeroselena agilis]|uniref:Glutathione S-transferase N-terminal domain-containing protein n=1 Tax=Anaeroselena agilis TaxID=3063788 RepID=A0ABU3NVL9_9FIRM|nr:glutathione S-transferase N-terminal domain-containing protein [Selenomonadales bacterium 4137-cl]
MEARLVLYNLHACPECQSIREKLAELELTYVCVNVSPSKAKRTQVFELTGQYSVPVLVDGDTILTSADNILEHLVEKYAHNVIKPVKY